MWIEIIMERAKEIVCAENVYRKGYTGKGVRIALLDTGVFTHRDLKCRIILFKDYINYRKLSYDDNGHGTHIAGILSEMSPGAELLIFKILDKNGNGTTEKALKALEWIQKNHRKWNIKLLNFSMGYLPNTNAVMQNRLIEKLEELWEEGITIVTAAGNNGPKENSITVPGVSRKVITVGSCDDIESGKGSYGGRGPTSCCIVKPEVLAPGTNIRSLSLRDGEYAYKSGTSMAAPIVCGALALALEKNPNLKPVELKLLLYDTVSQKIKNLSPAWGILNVDNLIKML
ncbi:MAG: S8 family peptidase [Agathobacter sp.]|nr:S8 family peptidase [Agathobacter sp.]